MIPVNSNGVPIGEIPFVRSGLLGFVGPVSRTILIKCICGYLINTGKPSVSYLIMTLPCYLHSAQGSLIFIVGKIEGLLLVSGRRHNADDLVATALAVEPVKTVYRGR